MTLFHCTVPGKPIPQGRGRHGKGRVYYGKRSVSQRGTLKSAFYFAHMDEHGNVHTERDTIAVPCSVTIEACGMRVDSDLDNHAKMVLDALQDAGVLASDDVRTVRELVVRVVDGEPRTVVTITAMPERG